MGLWLCLADATSLEAQCVQRWSESEVTLVNAPNSGMPYQACGDTSSGVSALLDGARVTGITLEFGTYAVEQLVQCVLGEYLIRHAAQRLDED